MLVDPPMIRTEFPETLFWEAVGDLGYEGTIYIDVQIPHISIKSKHQVADHVSFDHSQHFLSSQAPGSAIAIDQHSLKCGSIASVLMIM